MSVCLHISKNTCPYFTMFSVHIAYVPMAVAQSLCDNSAVHFALLVLWMTSCFLNGRV